MNEVIDVDNAPPFPRASRKRAAPKAVYQAEHFPTRRTILQRLVAIDESSDEEPEPARKSMSKSGGKVTNGRKHTETPAKEMGSKGPGSSRSSAASRRSAVVQVNYTVGHDPFKDNVLMKDPARYEQQSAASKRCP